MGVCRDANPGKAPYVTTSFPEQAEPRLTDPGLTDLTRRDWTAIAKRAVRESLDDGVTDTAAALAYYLFLAIPAALLLALGLFGLLAGPDAVETLVDKEAKALAVKWDDELVQATALTKDGAIVHPNFQPKTA